MVMLHYLNNNFERCRGFAFIVVLFFLQLVSLTSLFGLSQISVTMKKNLHEWDSEFYASIVDKMLQEVEARQISGANECSIPTIPGYELLHQPLSWWEANTCSDNMNEIRYYYAVELLGKDTCSVIGQMSSQRMAASYERITVYAQPTGMHGKYLIQSTIAIPSGEAPLCQGKPHKVSIGRQMSRIF